MFLCFVWVLVVGVAFDCFFGFVCLLLRIVDFDFEVVLDVAV